MDSFQDWRGWNIITEMLKSVEGWCMYEYGNHPSILVFLGFQFFHFECLNEGLKASPDELDDQKMFK